MARKVIILVYKFSTGMVCMGTVTTNRGNTVESQKWPLRDSSDTALKPQKSAKKKSSIISENSTIACVLF